MEKMNILLELEKVWKELMAECICYFLFFRCSTQTEGRLSPLDVMNSTFMEKERGNANRLSQISFIPTCLIVYNIITYELIV